MKISKLLYSAFILSITFVNIVDAQTKKQPNVLFVLVDDFGYKDLSVHGSKLYQTPNMDKLAKDGVDFQNAYASYPRCVPSRYGIMTGTYPVNEDHGNLGAIKEENNFIKKFNKAGYTSFYVGKWHLGSEESSPKGFGFKNSFAAGEAGGTDSHFYPFNGNRIPGAKDEKAPIEDVATYGKPGDFLSDVLTRRTIEYIKEDQSKPFIGVLAFYAVHTPIEAKPEDIERNKKEITNATPEYVTEGNGQTRITQNDPTYAGLVENTDENIGKLIETLKANGLYENTMIVLTSDHGGLSTRGKNNRIVPTSNLPYRAGKGWIYEGGIKVPLFVHYPKQIKAKVDTESIILGIDVFPTITDLALNEKAKDVDGQSFKNVIEGKDNWKNRTVYWNSYKARPSQTGDSKTSAIRVGDFKLLHFIETDKTELYNVKTDVSEKTDLALTMTDKTKEMLAQLNKWKADKKIKMKANHKSKETDVTTEPVDKKQAKKDAKKEAKKAERKAEKLKDKNEDE
jgi:arylsulfatase A-like enzyme